ncbi:MAG: rRNA maturation RNase YbeY [Bacteroidetes bacterium]|nr:rRNA maturation RNase YbeY [Bacteroidota bacterium]MDA0875494.1 rRNA maturation RNase YbeY [Bacteroidota bacterium]
MTAEGLSGSVDVSVVADVAGDDWEERIARTAARVFTGEGVPFVHLSVVLADHGTVHSLNREWLDHDWTTDVISFLLEEDPVEGEVYVDVETAAERHEEFGAPLSDEILRYVIHGILHLCGHDDATDAEREAMRRLEDRYLASSSGA